MRFRIYGQPNIVGLCVGTNGHHPRKLKWAQKDALDVAHVLSGVRGTLPGVHCMGEPTVGEVEAALASLAGRFPEVFILWISGHGTRDGVVFSDGVMPFTTLAARVAAVGADHSLVGLDTCYSGTYLLKKGALGDVVIGALDPGYLQALAEATPSARVICSVGANRLAGEDMGVQNGHMTAAFLEAACIIRGDTDGLITDSPLFDMIKMISVKRWRQQPYAFGLTSDFPVLHDQRDAIGTAAIYSADIVGFKYIVSAIVADRRGLPTRMRARLLSHSGVVLHELEWRFVPYEDHDVKSATFSVPVQAIQRDPVSLANHLSHGAVAVRWHVLIEDLRGRMLDERCDSAWIATKATGSGGY
jgi:hypothetical protein